MILDYRGFRVGISDYRESRVEILDYRDLGLDYRESRVEILYYRRSWILGDLELVISRAGISDR